MTTPEATATSSGENIRYEVSDGIGRITLARPEVRNAFTLSMIDHWITILHEPEVAGPSDSATR